MAASVLKSVRLAPRNQHAVAVAMLDATTALNQVTDVADADFREGHFDTNFIQRFLPREKLGNNAG
jgi:hypothetical protein